MKMISMAYFSPLFWPIRSTLNDIVDVLQLVIIRYVKYAIDPVLTFLSGLADKYKSDPSDAAGAGSEQLSDSNGWPAH